MDNPHELIDGYGIVNWHVRALLHVMVDIGHALACAHPGCKFGDRSFVARVPGRGHQGRTVVLDHITPRLSGGSDRLENLQLVHQDCNNQRAAGWSHTPETLAAIGAAKRAEFARDPDKFRERWAKRRPGWNLKTRADDQRGGRRKRFTPAEVESIRARRAGGVPAAVLAAEYNINVKTIYEVVGRKGAYSDVTT